MCKAVFVLLVSVATVVLGKDADDSVQLNRSLRSITDAEQLQREIKIIGPSCRKHAFLKEMVLDTAVPLAGRIALAQLLGNYGDDKMFARKILALSNNPEATELKMALMRGFMDRGAHLGLPADAIETVAENAEENEEVRGLAITWLIRAVNRNDENLKNLSASGQLGTGSVSRQGDAGHYREVLDGIAGKPETPDVLKKMIGQMIAASTSRTHLMKQNLKVVQAKLKAAQSETRSKDLSTLRRYQALINVWSCERDVFESEMLLAMELLRAYAAEHDGVMPSNIPKPDDVMLSMGPYRYLRIGSTKDLSADTIVLVAPKAHVFADGKTVFVQRGSGEVDVMSIGEFNRAVAKEAGTIRLAPSITQMQPALYIAHGDGRIIGYPKHLIKEVMARNNAKRRDAADPLVTDADALVEESFAGLQAIEMLAKQGPFPTSAVER